jgi:hypothetical protein
MARSCAADDFPAIRARLEELRRERARVSAKWESPGLRSSASTDRSSSIEDGSRIASPELRRILLRGRTA